MEEGAWQIVKRVFHAALDLPAGEREQFVRKECAGDDTVAKEVVALLFAHQEAAPSVGRSVLSDLDAELTSPEAPASSRLSSRYEVHGEIARGGVGIVLRGHDVDLGRDVAMKVIRPEHAEAPEVLRRFIEEAQVGAQLQHPGIVPVYEFGHDEDHRAFFTMKLIRGETLAAMFTARADPGEGRRRFLSVFEQICQTVAYAHARGVIHRDLKPANVMVGSFGEVQVVDWGFAKVLDRPDREPPEVEEEATATVRTVRSGSESDASRVGSVMGTPPYMPPEQAMGRSDQVDERADVFALGSILLETLTGLPAYTEEGLAGLRQAVTYDTAGAFERLDACPADEELVGLCRRCLAREVKDRPRSADAVARAVADHLTGVEERARAAEMRAETERVKAVEERRARKLTIGLAAAVLLAVLLGGGGYLLWQAAQRKNAEQVAGLVSEDVKQASALRGAAQGARFDLPRWDAAVVAATRATERAKSHGAKSMDLGRAEALLAEVTEEAATAKQNSEMLEALAEIRLTRGDRLDLKAAEDAYAAAFATLGIVGDGTDIEAATRKIAATGIAKELTAYLDEWLWIRGAVDGKRGHLLAIAKAVDPNPWRKGLRAAASAGDRLELLRLAAKADLTGNSPNLLARHLTALKERETAIDLLRRAQRERPEDFWLAYDLGFELTMIVPPRWEEAIGFFRVAQGIRPESREVRHQLAIALLKVKRPADAIEVIETALARHPDFLHLYDHLIEAYEQKGELDPLVSRWRSRTEKEPENPYAWYRLGRASEAARDVETLALAYSKAHRLDPDVPLFRERLALAHVYADDLKAARLLARGSGAHVEFPYVYALIMWLEDDNETVLQMIEEALARNPYRPFLLDMQLQILAEEGRHDEAYEANRRALAIYPDNITFNLGVAWILQQKEDLDGAIRVLQGIAHMPERLAEGRFKPTVEETTDIQTGKDLQRVVLRPWHQKATGWNLLGGVLRRRGRWREAVQSYEKCVELQPLGYTGRANLADSLTVFAEWERSNDLYEEILETEDDPYSLFFLLMGLLATGRNEDADGRLRELTAHPFVSKASEERRTAWARDMPICVAAVRDLPAIKAGKRVWSSSREKALSAWILVNTCEPVLAARLFEEVFAEDSSIGGGMSPYPKPWHFAGDAALAAVLASQGISPDSQSLSSEERIRWSKKALEWFRWDLALWKQENDPVEEVRQLREFKVNILLSNYRYEQCLADLPAEDAAAWKEIWAEVDARLARLESEEK